MVVITVATEVAMKEEEAPVVEINLVEIKSIGEERMEQTDMVEV